MNRFHTFTRFLAPVVFVLAFQAIGPDTPPGNAATGRLPADSPGQEVDIPALISSPNATDLVVDAIEVTQSVQDLNNSVPLIGGKRTFVRVYVHSNDTPHVTTAYLKIQVGAFSKTILPIPPVSRHPGKQRKQHRCSLRCGQSTPACCPPRPSCSKYPRSSPCSPL